MGETDNPKGDVTEQTSEGKEGTTSQEIQTFTKKQVEDAVAKARSDALTEVGRLRKAYEDTKQYADSAMSRIKQIEEESYRSQEEQAKDDPDELSRIRRRRQDAERQVKLEERETKVKTQLDRLLQVTAKELSKQYSVSDDILLKYAGEDADSMEVLAKSFGERTIPGKSVTRMTEQPDDGKTKGNTKGLTKEDVSKMSPEEQHRRMKEIAAIPF